MSDRTTLHDLDPLREVLTARLPADPRWVAWVDGVMGELARSDAPPVDVTPPQGIDRDALERLIIEARYSRGNRWTTEKFADAIEALVRPLGLDRDALEATLLRNGPTTWEELDARVMAEHVLALVRPAEGVVLTTDERRAFETADIVLRHHGFSPTADLLSALANRLEGDA